MFNRRRLIAWFDRRWVRRLVIVPVTLISAIVGLALSPVIILAAFASDIIRGRQGLPRTRITLLIIGALLIESVGIIVSLLFWIGTGFGLLGQDRWRWRLYRGFMGRYTSALLALITRIIGTSVVWRDQADLSAGPVIFIARHTSFFDAVIPAVVLARRNNLLAHHVVTFGLRYSPVIDIVGNRFPNRFIKRTPGQGSAELERIGEVGVHLDERSAVIIFPEGTFRTADRFERSVRRLRRRQPLLAERAELLQHVLPPRAHGTYALLQGAPEADVVMCTHTGFESFGSIKQIVASPFAERSIVVETWRYQRADIPEGPDDFASWLFERYVEIDEWVAAQIDGWPAE